MRKRLPESAKRFIALVETSPIEDLAQEVRFLVTGSTEAFGGERTILHREMLASSSHIRIFTALGLLYGLTQKEVFEVYKRLPAERQKRIDAMVKLSIAEEIEDQGIRQQSPPDSAHAPVESLPISLLAELRGMNSICSDLGIPPH